MIGFEVESRVHVEPLFPWGVEPLMVRVVENEGRPFGAEVGELKNL